jgi:DNA-binding MarR family transcriptional regulator
MPEDEVDRIAAAWQRAQPDLDVAPLHVLSRVTRLARHLDLARRQAFAAHALDLGEFDVLAALRRAGAPYALSPGQLATETLVTSGTITNRIDRLEARGLVTREPDQDDRRGVRVLLTPTGRAVVDDALRDLLARERDLLAVLPAADRERLAGLLRDLVLAFTPDEGPTARGSADAPESRAR